MKNNENHLQNNERSMKNNEKHLENNEKKHKLGFQRKTRVPREKSGRHSTIYLVLKPVNNSGTAF